MGDPSAMPGRLVRVIATGLTVALAIPVEGSAGERDLAARQAQCAAARVAVEHMLRVETGMRLAYAVDLPRVSVTEGSWTRRMPLPFLAQFDATPHASAISICPELRASLEARGAMRVDGVAEDEQRGRRKGDRIAVVRATLPVLSPDGKGAIVRAEVRCGYGCGVGDTLYLTLVDGVWAYTALRMEWSGTADFLD